MQGKCSPDTEFLKKKQDPISFESIVPANSVRQHIKRMNTMTTRVSPAIQGKFSARVCINITQQINRLNNMNHMIILKDAKKCISIDVKTFLKIGME